ncbi:hypothetical protein LL946_10860 [Knoellia locipacati]|uniref:hypothetical protein n=1 Tax=Knoellia locipacati TaxID=882824 RepID=UPI00384D9442
MPLPLILGAIALIAAGGGGATAGAIGAIDMAEAKKVAGRSRERYEAALAGHAKHEKKTGDHLASYGRRQIEVQTTTLAGWVSWLEANERKIKRLDRTVVDGLQVARLDLPALRNLVNQGKLLQGGVGAAVSAVVAQQAALSGVRALAAAGTGAAISTLSGAAAESATLAWLGGGTLAAGGGGMAAGGMMLTGFAIAPALLIGGITLAIQGEKALTQAKQYEADVKKAQAEMDLQVDLMKRLRRRSDELRSVLDQLDERAKSSLKELLKLDFDPDRDLEHFQQTALLMAEIGLVLSAPLLDENGTLTQESLTIIERNAA